MRPRLSPKGCLEATKYRKSAGWIHGLIMEVCRVRLMEYLSDLWLSVFLGSVSLMLVLKQTIPGSMAHPMVMGARLPVSRTLPASFALLQKSQTEAAEVRAALYHPPPPHKLNHQVEAMKPLMELLQGAVGMGTWCVEVLVGSQAVTSSASGSAVMPSCFLGPGEARLGDSLQGAQSYELPPLLSVSPKSMDPIKDFNGIFATSLQDPTSIRMVGMLPLLLMYCV